MIRTLRDLIAGNWQRVSKDYRIERLADGTASRAETAEFREEARHDPSLRHALESTMELTRGLRELPDVAVPVDFVQVAQRRIQAEPVEEREQRAAWSPLRLAVAFGAGATVATALVVMTLSTPMKPQPVGTVESNAPARWVVTRVEGTSESVSSLGATEAALGDVLTGGAQLRVGDGELRTVVAGTHVGLKANTVVTILDPAPEHPALTLDSGELDVAVAEGNAILEVRLRGRLERVAVRGRAEIQHDGETTLVKAVEGRVEIIAQTQRIELAAGETWAVPLVISDEVIELPVPAAENPPPAPVRTPKSTKTPGVIGTEWEWDDTP